MNIDISELKNSLKDLSQKFQTLGRISLTLPARRHARPSSKRLMAKQDFWENPEASRDVLKERSELNGIIQTWRSLG